MNIKTAKAEINQAQKENRMPVLSMDEILVETKTYAADGRVFKAGRCTLADYEDQFGAFDALAESVDGRRVFRRKDGTVSSEMIFSVATR